MRKVMEMMVMLTILMVVVVLLVYTYVKTYQFVHFGKLAVYQLYFNKAVF